MPRRLSGVRRRGLQRFSSTFCAAAGYVFLSALAGYAMEKKSTIIAIGLTVHNTPVDIREKLAVPEAEWPRAIAELTSFPHIEEAAVLSTCNRMELYIVALSQRRGTREVGARRNILYMLRTGSAD